MIEFEDLFTTTEPDVLTSTTEEPQFQGDDAKYLIVPLVVIVVVMLLSLLVYCMAKRRRMSKLRRDIARLYQYDQNESEWENLISYEHPYYNSNEFTVSLSKSDCFLPTTNL